MKRRAHKEHYEPQKPEETKVMVSGVVYNPPNPPVRYEKRCSSVAHAGDWLRDFVVDVLPKSDVSGLDFSLVNFESHNCTYLGRAGQEEKGGK